MAHVKEQIKAPKTELSNKEIANLSHAYFKTLVIRMLTEMVEYGLKLEEKVKAMKNEIKENVQEPTLTGRKPGPVSYTHLTLPTTIGWCRSRWSPYH